MARDVTQSLLRCLDGRAKRFERSSRFRSPASRESLMPLHRRTFLRAAGVALALPVFDALVPRTARAAASAGNSVSTPRRMVCINTPLGLTILNQVDRFSLAIDVVDRVPRLKDSGAHVKARLQDQILEHLAYAKEHGVDKPEIRDWKWAP